MKNFEFNSVKELSKEEITHIQGGASAEAWGYYIGYKIGVMTKSAECAAKRFMEFLFS
ncbi:hypothetical protein GCM10009122_44370 [Fulvivirga kasyanovii]|uniref:hypothetical protein n=1 Tax=Fulvivirga kasyanovii TaxID=396812 RepID=UPI0031D12124